MLVLRHVTSLATALALTALLVAGCGGDSDGDVAYVRTQSAYATAQSGLTRAQQGLAMYKAGDTAGGWTAMNEGMQAASNGASGMRSGFGMMQGVTTCGMRPEEMMGQLDDGMVRARRGLSAMQTPDAAQQSTGMQMMQDDGLPKMQSAMQQAGAALACIEACSGGNKGGGMMGGR